MIGWALLLAALTIGAYLRLTNYFGVMRVDSFNYVDVALALLRQEPIFDDAHLAIVVHAVRLTLILPMVPIFLLLGADERSATLWPLLCSLGSIALSWLIGRRLGGRLVGALSALIVAVYPIEVLLATQLLPDAVLACFVLVAVYAYMRADEPDEIGSVQRFALAGGALGLAYYARINAPVVLLFLLAYSAVRRRISVGLLGLAIGFLSVLALGELLFYLNGGVPLFGLTRHLRIVGVNPEFTRAPDWTAFVRMLWNNPLFRPWTLALVASLLPLMLLRPRRWWVGPLWLASTLLYLDVLSQWPTVSLPEKGDRMLTILAAPLALTIAMGAAAAVGRVPWATARGGLIVALAAAAVPLVALPGLRPIPAERQAFVEWRGRYVRQLADAVGALPRGDVQLVNDWRAWIALYRGYGPESLRPGGPARTARLDNGATARLLRVRQDERLMVLDSAGAYVLQDVGVMLRRPADWQPVSQIDPTTTIFFAPPDLDERRWVVHLEPELFDAVVPDQDNRLAQMPGWGSYSQPAYSRGKAAIARVVGARMSRVVPPLPAGDLRLKLRVYDYGGGGQNLIAVTLNDARTEVAWGSPEPGIKELTIPIAPSRGGGDLQIELLARGQSYAIVDAIDVLPGG